jgi:hypothetical protein
MVLTTARYDAKEASADKRIRYILSAFVPSLPPFAIDLLRPISIESMLTTLALAVLTWGKKAEPEPEPASTLGMTLLAVGVCWVPPSVETWHGMAWQASAAPRGGLAEVGRSSGQPGACTDAGGRLRSPSLPKAQPPWCLDLVLPLVLLKLGLPPYCPTTLTTRPHHTLPPYHRTALSSYHPTTLGAAAGDPQVR